MRHTYVVLLAATLVQAGAAFAQSADNSKSNADPANSTDKSSIADGQGNDHQDLMLTQAIRKNVMADKDSLYQRAKRENRHRERLCDIERRGAQ
ncbi:MAG: hypothetical protein WDM77_00845 [Steroidobacteraceae bacterium]